MSDTPLDDLDDASAVAGKVVWTLCSRLALASGLYALIPRALVEVLATCLGFAWILASWVSHHHAMGGRTAGGGGVCAFGRAVSDVHVRPVGSSARLVVPTRAVLSAVFAFEYVVALLTHTAESIRRVKMRTSGGCEKRPGIDRRADHVLPRLTSGLYPGLHGVTGMCDETGHGPVTALVASPWRAAARVALPYVTLAFIVGDYVDHVASRRRAASSRRSAVERLTIEAEAEEADDIDPRDASNAARGDRINPPDPRGEEEQPRRRFRERAGDRAVDAPRLRGFSAQVMHEDRVERHEHFEFRRIAVADAGASTWRVAFRLHERARLTRVLHVLRQHGEARRGRLVGSAWPESVDTNAETLVAALLCIVGYPAATIAALTTEWSSEMWAVIVSVAAAVTVRRLALGAFQRARNGERPRRDLHFFGGAAFLGRCARCRVRRGASVLDGRCPACRRRR